MAAAQPPGSCATPAAAADTRSPMRALVREIMDREWAATRAVASPAVPPPPLWTTTDFEQYMTSINSRTTTTPERRRADARKRLALFFTSTEDRTKAFAEYERLSEAHNVTEATTFSQLIRTPAFLPHQQQLKEKYAALQKKRAAVAALLDKSDVMAERATEAIASLDVLRLMFAGCCHDVQAEADAVLAAAESDLRDATGPPRAADTPEVASRRAALDAARARRDAARVGKELGTLAMKRALQAVLDCRKPAGDARVRDEIDRRRAGLRSSLSDDLFVYANEQMFDTTLDMFYVLVSAVYGEDVARNWKPDALNRAETMIREAAAGDGPALAKNADLARKFCSHAEAKKTRKRCFHLGLPTSPAGPSRKRSRRSRR